MHYNWHVFYTQAKIKFPLYSIVIILCVSLLALPNFYSHAESITLKENSTVPYPGLPLARKKNLKRIVQPQIDNTTTTWNAFSILPKYAKHSSLLSLKGFDSSNFGFAHMINDIFNQVASSSPMNKGSAWMNLALFYLANGFYREAHSITAIANNAPDSLLKHDYRAMLARTVIAFMEKQYVDAYHYAHSIPLNVVNFPNKNEVMFWQTISQMQYAILEPDKMISAQVNAMPPLDTLNIFIKHENNFLRGYNDHILEAIGLTIIQYNLQYYNFFAVSEALNTCSKFNITPDERNQLTYYIAKYHIAQKEEKMAISYLDKCIANIDDQKHYVLCNLEKAHILSQRLPKEEARYINTLKNMQVIWRGDEIEASVLKNLGDWYHSQKNYIQAMHFWKILTDNFSTAEAINILNKMGTTFIKFFTAPEFSTASPLQILVFFREYQQFTPLDTLGDTIVLKAITYFIELDLLDEAIVLLTHQINERLSGYRKEQAINSLAKTYIKKKLFTKVIDLIESNSLMAKKNKFDTSEHGLFDGIFRTRLHLYAKALLQTNNYNKMIEILKTDDTQDSDTLRANAYWQEQKWTLFNDASEPYLYTIRDAKNKLSDSDITRIIKQITSYAATGQKKLLNATYLDFVNRLPQDSSKTDIIKIWTQLFGSNHEINLKEWELFTSLKDLLNAERIL